MIHWVPWFKITCIGKRITEKYWLRQRHANDVSCYRDCLKRCKCLLCHDSATIYLQFNSIGKSNITVYCQLERRKKMESSVSEEGFCSLAHLLVLKLLFWTSLSLSTWWSNVLVTNLDCLRPWSQWGGSIHKQPTMHDNAVRLIGKSSLRRTIVYQRGFGENFHPDYKM